MKKSLVLGAGGFIGSHLVRQLKSDGFYVRGVDMHEPEFSKSPADDFVIGDLRDKYFCHDVFEPGYDRVYQLAADMGGAGYIFSGDHDASIMTNSVQINLNVLNRAVEMKPKQLFFSSSACIYPDPKEYTEDIYSEPYAYPAAPDSEYGWEKLFSERLYEAHRRNFGLNIRIARLHNVFGPEGAWQGGKEKATAAICRKVSLANENESIEIWGDGQQTRSFLFIDECIEGIERLMKSPYTSPINIGSSEMISIQDLTEMIIGISGKKIKIKNIPGPEGVAVRTSNNALISQELNWAPSYPLLKGVELTYRWIDSQIKKG